MSNVVPSSDGGQSSDDQQMVDPQRLADQQRWVDEQSSNTQQQQSTSQPQRLTFPNEARDMLPIVIKVVYSPNSRQAPGAPIETTIACNVSHLSEMWWLVQHSGPMRRWLWEKHCVHEPYDVEYVRVVVTNRQGEHTKTYTQPFGKRSELPDPRPWHVFPWKDMEEYMISEEERLALSLPMPALEVGIDGSRKGPHR